VDEVIAGKLLMRLTVSGAPPQHPRALQQVRGNLKKDTARCNRACPRAF